MGRMNHQIDLPPICPRGTLFPLRWQAAASTIFCQRFAPLRTRTLKGAANNAARSQRMVKPHSSLDSCPRRNFLDRADLLRLPSLGAAWPSLAKRLKTRPAGFPRFGWCTAAASPLSKSNPRQGPSPQKFYWFRWEALITWVSGFPASGLAVLHRRLAAGRQRLKYRNGRGRGDRSRDAVRRFRRVRRDLEIAAGAQAGFSPQRSAICWWSRSPTGLPM